MTFSHFHTFLSHVKEQNDLSEIYFLHAEDNWQVRKIMQVLTKKFTHVNGKSESNMYTLEGSAITVPDVVAAIQNQSLFSNSNFILVRNAEKLKKHTTLLKHLDTIEANYVLFLHWGGRKSKALEEFKEYSLKKGATISLKSFNQAEISEIIHEEATKRKITVENEVISRLCDFSSNNMTTISRELEKLFTIGEKEGKVTMEDFITYTSLENEYTGFQLNKEIADRNISVCLKIVSKIGTSDKTAFPVIIGTLHSFFSKGIIFAKYRNEKSDVLAKKLGVSPQGFFYAQRDYSALCANFKGIQLLQAMELIKEYDLKSKGVNSYGLEDNFLLDLVLRILVV